MLKIVIKREPLFLNEGTFLHQLLALHFKTYFRLEDHKVTLKF
jgi:hypothetical protein